MQYYSKFSTATAYEAVDWSTHPDRIHGYRVCVQIAGRKNLRFYSPEGGLDMSIFTEYISVEVYNQTPKNKLEKYLLSGGSTKFSTVCVYRY